MSEQTIDYDANPPVATNEYDDMVRLALPGYEVMHTIVLSFLRFHLPETANLLIVGAGTGISKQHLCCSSGHLFRISCPLFASHVGKLGF